MTESNTPQVTPSTLPCVPQGRRRVRSKDHLFSCVDPKGPHKADEEVVGFEPTPTGDIQFQLAKIQEALGYLQEGIRGGFSPLWSLQLLDVSSNGGGYHTFYPQLQEAIKVIADYVDTVMAPQGVFEALLWDIKKGNLLGKVLQIPVSSEFGDDTDAVSESILLEIGGGIGSGYLLDGASFFHIYREYRDPETEEVSPTVVYSSEGGRQNDTLTLEEYDALKEAISEYDQEVLVMKDRILASQKSPEWISMMESLKTEDDEVVPRGEW